MFNLSNIRSFTVIIPYPLMLAKSEPPPDICPDNFLFKQPGYRRKRLFIGGDGKVIGPEVHKTFVEGIVCLGSI